MEYKSFAKLNLFLDVISCYKNGYHSIKSLFVETNLFDTIQFERNDIGKIRIFDKSNILPEENLLKKASDKFIGVVGKIPFGIDFYIEKNIPIGGGMGGGSSNAASVLKILNKAWNINFSQKKLELIGVKIGADVPYFVKGGVQKVFGIGEILKKLKTKKIDLNILLIFPEISVSTPEAYKMIDEAKICKETYFNNKKFKNLISGFENGSYSQIVDNLYNKFEEVVFKKHNILSEIKANILKSGADVSLMSGSGSTMFGIYENSKKLEDGIEHLLKYNYKFKNIRLNF
ncbi:MAG: 4-(cytidine 5'-diphospho)-2-C-methyl-D-erythritol kinase [Spirochaetes bacterium GWD1_27_9]|nr:MAG: 4-(cytidine 5'-diphospho)-2-C-methyl-D-erythritol kinase [Spirochaetes bacterium GWC1_27_15]OHD41614.1 MAG: 4-(cytidine 5'-diphospho)-2-C-methyl-D-erythritol kinase [Spirochaetes bacterium GWD1_27_9]